MLLLSLLPLQEQCSNPERGNRQQSAVASKMHSGHRPPQLDSTQATPTAAARAPVAAVYAAVAASAGTGKAGTTQALPSSAAAPAVAAVAANTQMAKMKGKSVDAAAVFAAADTQRAGKKGAPTAFASAVAVLKSPQSRARKRLQLSFVCKSAGLHPKLLLLHEEAWGQAKRMAPSGVGVVLLRRFSVAVAAAAKRASQGLLRQDCGGCYCCS